MIRLSLLASLLLGACAPSVSTTKPVAPIVQPKLDRAQIRAKLAARRTVTVQHFLDYREARVYPVNQLPGGGLRHVWVDAGGNLCAAATLISHDWGRDAAARVGAGNIEIKLADVRRGAVADWILTSGLTHSEIVAIQLPGDFQEMPQVQENQRMYQIYVDVERQIRSLWDENLDRAVDELMKRPDLARAVLAGGFAQPTAG